MAWLQPPITGDSQLDSWTLRIAQQINQGLVPGATGGTGGGGGEGGSGNSPLYLYQRTMTDASPAAPSRVVFNFENSPVVSEADEGWLAAIPDIEQGGYLWVTFRYTSAQSGIIQNANSWDTPALLSTPGGEAGDNAQTVIITIRVPQTDYTTDPLTWDLHPEGEFRNDMGEELVLVATAYNGGTEYTFGQHGSFTFTWERNGMAFTPTVELDGNPQTPNRRFLVLQAADVDGGSDQFTCNIPEI